MENYKEEIRATRQNSLGSSDGRMLLQIAQLGYVPKSAYKRLAVCKGLCEQDDIPYTDAVRTGDEIEMCIYNYLKNNDSRYQSNPMLVSKRYSRKNVRLISHIDFMLKDENTKTLYMYECKASKFSFEQVRQEYKAQLFIHSLLGQEMVSELGKDWRLRLFLCHYDTNGLNLENGVEFDTKRLTLKQLRIERRYFNIDKSMDIVDNFLETFTEYYEGETINADLLPSNVKTKFDMIVTALTQIKTLETQIKGFKQHLYEFMLERNLKGIENSEFNVTLINDTESHTFDYKKFLEDERQLHPTKTKRLEKKYEKVVNKKGYVTIKIKNTNN